MRLRFGLAALSNRHFEHMLFPIGTRHDAYLPRYAEVFDHLELAVLYHQPMDERVRGWLEQAPPGFTFSAKLTKDAVRPESGVTDPGAALRPLQDLEPARAAGGLGHVVLQFPASFEQTPENLAGLEDLLDVGAPGTFAVELRHPSWWTPSTRALLEGAHAPLVWGTMPKAKTPDWVTADAGYVRFVGTHHNTRGRHIKVEDRLEDVLEMRARLAKEPWDACTLIVTNTFEGNALDSLPRICAALGDEALARQVTRRPGRPLFDDT